MARKKKESPQNGIIHLISSLPEDSDRMDDEMDEMDEMDDMENEDFSDAMMEMFLSKMLGGAGGGMSNEQYKGMLLDSLQPWKEVLKLAQEGDSQKVIEKAKEQISLINKKLKF